MNTLIPYINCNQMCDGHSGRYEFSVYINEQCLILFMVLPTFSFLMYKNKSVKNIPKMTEISLKKNVDIPEIFQFCNIRLRILGQSNYKLNQL